MHKLPNETTLKKRLSEGLRQRGIPHWSAAAGPYAHSGIADKIGCLPWSGRMLWLEVKRPGTDAWNALTHLQRRRADEYRAAGALVIVTSDYDEAMRLIDEDRVGARVQYPDNDEKAADVPDSTLTNRQANELLERNADLEDKSDWLLRNDPNMGYGNA